MCSGTRDITRPRTPRIRGAHEREKPAPRHREPQRTSTARARDILSRTGPPPAFPPRGCAEGVRRGGAPRGCAEGVRRGGAPRGCAEGVRRGGAPRGCAEGVRRGGAPGGAPRGCAEGVRRGGAPRGCAEGVRRGGAPRGCAEGVRRGGAPRGCAEGVRRGGAYGLSSAPSVIDREEPPLAGSVLTCVTLCACPVGRQTTGQRLDK